LGVYRVKETTKEEFVANVIQIEMQCSHFDTAPHATRVINATTAY
jgi:hypothetical protein